MKATTLSPRDGGVATRSTMTDNGDGSISAAWEVDDQLFVRYTNTVGDDVETTAIVTAVNPTTKAATISVTLTNPKDGGDIMFGYPRGHFDGSNEFYNDQIGTLDDINANHASINGYGTLAVSGSDVTLPAVTMDPDICIWKFSFTDGSSNITSNITKLVIDIPDSDPINNQTYTVSPTSQNTIYVAMYGNVTDQPISIYAQTTTGVYRKTATNVTLASGYTYTTTGLALTAAAAANAVAGDVGKVIGADGNIYPRAAIATNFGTTARAIIAYVGSAGSVDAGSATYKGLAIAMSDYNYARKWADASGDCLSSQTDVFATALSYKNGISCTSTLTGDGHTHAAAAAAVDNNGTAAPTGTSGWFLPSLGQWNLIVQGLATKKMGSAVTTDLTNETPNDTYKKDNLNSVITDAGGTGFKSDYWTSTEKASGSAWTVYFVWGCASFNEKANAINVRSVLAF